MVFTPKYRKKALFGPIRKELKDVFHRLATQKNCKIEEGHLMPDHIFTCLSRSPRSLRWQAWWGFLKGKSSIWVAQNIAGKKQNFVGHKFWARGSYVSTIGADEKVIRAYIRNQESEDKRLDELSLFDRSK